MFSPFPPEVKKIGLTTPSKVPDGTAFAAALETLRALKMDFSVSPHALESGEEDYFASTSALRTADFNALLRDESIELILCTRGGYGAAYLLDGIDWDTLRRRRLPVCGYSDVTALHLAMLARHAGVPVTGQMAVHLPTASLDAFTMNSQRRALSVALGLTDQPEHVTLRPAGNFSGPVSGAFIPANLCVLTSLCGSPWLPDFSGAILAVEEIDEEPRKLDRMILQLEMNGIFDRAAAVVGGYFTGECGSENDRMRIFRRFAARHPDTPFFTGLPFGHERPGLSFVCGKTASIDANGVLTAY